ncbi:RU1C-like protein [Mya arenaria]|uniref:U1 small nuclear ribonucleoprotein C n=1 Tax=Mya arenaria TaxID=6604 RepID=A0ABY7E1I1_MYAAR|nr:U1 small nuclear ribonucleoprotein C-like [Mya arenaria]WAR03044.1 RU1C-like protein [Mya arenaria]
MPKYYCDYCDTYLTHDSPSVRKTHCSGRKHKENVRLYYQKWLEEQVQKLVDDTTAAFKAGSSGPKPGPMPVGPIPGPPGMVPTVASMGGPMGNPMPLMGPPRPGPMMMPGMRQMVPMGGMGGMGMGPPMQFRPGGPPMMGGPPGPRMMNR